MNAPSIQSLAPSERSLGAILVDTGRLSPADLERISALQKQDGLRFGDAAVKLGLVSERDIRFALASQFDYPYLLRGQSEVSEEVVAAYEPFGRRVEALRALRSHLMMRWFEADVGRSTLAIVSPGQGDGRSWLTANLGVVFSQLGQRTLLIDADLRKPRLQTMFGLSDQSGLSAVLAGRVGLEAIQQVPALPNLSVLPSGPVPPNPQELLARPAMTQLLLELSQEFGAILIDTPSGSQFADAQTTAMRAGGALLVARRNATRVAAMRTLAEQLGDAGVTVVGTILNRD